MSTGTTLFMPDGDYMCFPEIPTRFFDDHTDNHFPFQGGVSLCDDVECIGWGHENLQGLARKFAAWISLECDVSYSVNICKFEVLDGRHIHVLLVGPISPDDDSKAYAQFTVDHFGLRDRLMEKTHKTDISKLVKK